MPIRPLVTLNPQHLPPANMFLKMGLVDSACPLALWGHFNIWAGLLGFLRYNAFLPSALQRVMKLRVFIPSSSTSRWCGDVRKAPKEKAAYNIR